MHLHLKDFGINREMTPKTKISENSIFCHIVNVKLAFLRTLQPICHVRGAKVCIFCRLMSTQEGSGIRISNFRFIRRDLQSGVEL